MARDKFAAPRVVISMTSIDNQILRVAAKDLYMKLDMSTLVPVSLCLL